MVLGIAYWFSLCYADPSVFMPIKGEKPMKPRNVTVVLTCFVVLVLAYKATDRYLVARTVSPPDASFIQILRTAISPRYEIATPHLTVFSHLKGIIFPTVLACGSCNGTLPRPACYSDCPPGMCQCPNCTASGGCTVYTCQNVQNTKTACTFGWGTSPCETCELDKEITCTP